MNATTELKKISTDRVTPEPFRDDNKYKIRQRLARKMQKAIFSHLFMLFVYDIIKLMKFLYKMVIIRLMCHLLERLLLPQNKF